MPQMILPVIPQGATQIHDLVSVYRTDNRWTYYMGMLPIYSHGPKDLQMFRFVTSQLIESGACRQVDIINAFGVSKRSVIRSLKKLRTGGIEAFFKKRKVRHGGKVFTAEVLEKAQQLLDQEYTRREVSEELGVKYDTLRKAINDSRLRERKPAEESITKSSRNAVDTAASEGMGTACTRVEHRLAASLGKCMEAPIEFETCLDVPKGGVLCALPALLINGMLEGAEKLPGKLKGYYTTIQILLLLACMSLCRIKTTEKLRGHAPGEFGKLLGLDRIPEVRCLRQKMDSLSAGGKAEVWAACLSKHWMNTESDAAGSFYIDGHVRVYHGRLTKLPRHYVTRERLCLRGTTDYWVNDAIGRPFFVVEKTIDPGLLNTLRDDIVPRLLNDLPNRPTEEQFAGNLYLCCMVLIFDREGYSPAFIRDMWQKHRVSCMTYHKYPGEAWPVDWFTTHEVTMPGGEVVSMRLAEMGTLIGSGKSAIWVKEVRKLTDSGHQTSLISTAYELPHTQLSGRMFSRWCQENFFKYMMEHFAIDLLQEYGTVEFPDTEKVINPVWREKTRELNSLQNKIRYRLARFAEMTMYPEIEDNQKPYNKWMKKKAELLEEIEHYHHQIETIKAQKKETKKHISFGELAAEDKFSKLLPGRRRLMDTIRMIAYRAETSMAAMLTGSTVDTSAARRILQDLFVTDADILPEPQNSILRVRVHSASRPAVNRSLASLFVQLNNAEMKYPGTDMKIIYELGGFTGRIYQEGVT